MNLINHSQLSHLLGSRLLAIGLHSSYYCFISQKSTILNYWQLWRIMVFLQNFSTNRVQEWRNSDTFWKCIGSLMGIFSRLTGPAHPYHFENRNASSVLMRIIWLEKSLEHDSLTGHIYIYLKWNSWCFSEKNSWSPLMHNVPNANGVCAWICIGCGYVCRS